MQEKRTFWQEQLAQVCSQIVYVFFFVCSLNLACFAENTIKLGFHPKTQNKQNILC